MPSRVGVRQTGAHEEGGAEDLERVRELRQRGLTPKEIARAVGLAPARVTQLIKAVAAAETTDPTEVRSWSAG